MKTSTTAYDLQCAANISTAWGGLMIQAANELEAAERLSAAMINEIEATQKLYRSWHDRALKAEQKVKELRMALSESCEDMRSEYRTCDLAFKAEQKLKAIGEEITNMEKSAASFVWIRKIKAILEDKP